jgi:hypothetical protein
VYRTEQTAFSEPGDGNRVWTVRDPGEGPSLSTTQVSLLQSCLADAAGCLDEAEAGLLGGRPLGLPQDSAGLVDQ